MKKDGQNNRTPAAASFGGFRGRVLTGILLSLLLLGGVGGWAATATLTGAVITAGSVTVDQNLKVVQHRDGGIVASIEVREGESVAEGQVLIRLDDAQSLAELSILRTQLREAEARRARLTADRVGDAEIDFPASLVAARDPASVETMAGETRLHVGNLANRRNQRQQLELSIEQIGEEIRGLESQKDALVQEIALFEQMHERLVGLSDDGLVEISRLDASNREGAQLRGRLGELDASIARSRAKIGEVQMQILAIDEQARTEAQRELVVVEGRINELSDRIAAVEDRLSRTEIRSPVAGRVNELNIFTEGGVITPAQVLATIVPDDAALRVAIRIPPVAIDQVSVGQPARVRFTAFNHRTTPELVASVAQVGSATQQDETTGESYYAGYVEFEADELAKLDRLELLPGMPAEVYLSTQEQTAISYLLRPISDQARRAFREE